MSKHITTGTTAPATTPAGVGHHYIDTVSGKAYVSTGTSSSADWSEGGGGGFGQELTILNSTSTFTIDPDNVAIYACSGANAYTVNVPAYNAAWVGVLTKVEFRFSGAGVPTFTWSGSITWPGGSAPNFDNANIGYTADVIELYTVDGGTTWVGAYMTEGMNG